MVYVCVKEKEKGRSEKVLGDALIQEDRNEQHVPAGVHTLYMVNPRS